MVMMDLQFIKKYMNQHVLASQHMYEVTIKIELTNLRRLKLLLQITFKKVMLL